MSDSTTQSHAQISKENPNHVPTLKRSRVSSLAITSLVDVLEMVRLGTAKTRQELEQKGNLGRATVADRLNKLSELGLIDESVSGQAIRGRAPKLVRFSQDRAVLAVITLDQTAIGVGLANLSGALITEHHETIDLTEAPEQTIKRLIALIAWILDRQPSSPDLWGISVSVPDSIPNDSAVPFLMKTPDFLHGWGESLLVEKLIEEYCVPVWITSSVETMTMGEQHSGQGIETRSMLFIKIGKRIGAGLVIDGQLYSGGAGAVGLIGELPINSDGKTGSLNSLAGSENILREGLAAAQSGRSPSLSAILQRDGEVTVNDVCQAAQISDPACSAILMNSGRLIGGVIAMLTNMLNPQLIVLAGIPAQTNDILLAAVREAVYGASHPLVTRDLKIVRSNMSTSAALLGAATVGVEALFAPMMLRNWLLEGSPSRHPELLGVNKTENDTDEKIWA